MFTLNHTELRESYASSLSSSSLDTLLVKAEQGFGLTLIETSALYTALQPSHLDEARVVAESLRLQTKGSYAISYTCSYLTSDCLNDCGYCPYRKSNPNIKRVTLSLPEFLADIDAVQKLGHKNVILIGGTVPEKHYKSLIIPATHYALQKGINPWIEFENLSEETLTELQKAGANTFLLFQESYKSQVFRAYHRTSVIKNDYTARLETQDRALQAGFSHLGIGVLFGLHRDVLYDLLGLYSHAKYLEDHNASIFISTPTIKKGTGLSPKIRFSELDLERVLITLRLALPRTSLALSARESAAFRDRLFGVVDYIGYGGTPFPGGRTIHHAAHATGQTQFQLEDSRSRSELDAVLQKRGIKFI